MSAPLKILHVTSEMVPLLSTGGLAEVTYALPRALHANGHDVRVAMPCYRGIPAEYRGESLEICSAQLGGRPVHGALRASRVPGTEISLYLIEHGGYFDRPEAYGEGGGAYPDNLERFCFFCQAVLDAVPRTGWLPDIVHCHDWQSAPLVIYLKTGHPCASVWNGSATVFTIHNLAYQGRFTSDQYAVTDFDPALFHKACLEFHGDLNLMKGAIAFGDRLNTVSPRYAQEIQLPDYGAGLDGMLQQHCEHLSGILNGVDYGVWNPETDPAIAANYSRSDLSGKAACKAALQRRFGLPEKNVPLFGIVSRFAWQKGTDLLVAGLEQILGMELQLAVLGTGDALLEHALVKAAQRQPEKLGVALDFNPALSHQLQAGSDFLLMPSRYEPCGLSQLFALAYGTIPVVRRTGGLVNSVRDLNPVHRRHGDATGIAFVPSTHQALTRAVQRAVELYADAELMERLRLNGMAEDFSWDRSSGEYVALYRQALAKT